VRACGAGQMACLFCHGAMRRWVGRRRHVGLQLGGRCCYPTQARASAPVVWDGGGWEPPRSATSSVHGLALPCLACLAGLSWPARTARPNRQPVTTWRHGTAETVRAAPAAKEEGRRDRHRDRQTRRRSSSSSSSNAWAVKCSASGSVARRDNCGVNGIKQRQHPSHNGRKYTVWPGFSREVCWVADLLHSSSQSLDRHK
jgi:hypothetical protein